MSIGLNEFAPFFAEQVVNQKVELDIGGKRDLHAMLNSSPGSKTLIVVFHGAYDRNKRTYPMFLDREEIGVEAHRLSLADPSLERDEQLALGWFAGDEELPLQKLLPVYLKNLVKKLSLERVIFMGSSGGGFASLFYSWHLPKSIAVVKIPQTRILEYRLPANDKYLQACWPNGLDQYGDDAPILDLTELYSKRVRNQVIYIQSAFDLHHLHDHMVPFLAALPSEARKRFFIKSSYWGLAGHSNSVPLEEWDTWGRAAVEAGTPTVGDIAKKYLLADLEKGPKLGQFQKSYEQRKGTVSSTDVVQQQDFDWANVVSNSQTLEEK